MKGCTCRVRKPQFGHQRHVAGWLMSVLVAVGLFSGLSWSRGPHEENSRPASTPTAGAMPQLRPRQSLSCAYRAAVFCLEYFGRHYSPIVLDKLLPITEQGTRMSDLLTALEAHGLDVVARKGVNLPGLEATLRRDVLAVLPVQIHPQCWHYVVACYHPQRGHVIVDPPYLVQSLRQFLAERSEQEPEGVALFVERAALSKPLAQTIRVSPTPVDFGSVKQDEISPSNPMVRKVTLQNDGNRPTALWFSLEGGYDVRCEPVLLRSGQSWEMEVALLRCGYPHSGPTRDTVLIQFPDGSKKRLQTLVHYVPGSAKPWPELRPDFIRLSVPLDAQPGQVLSGQALYEARIPLPQEPVLQELPDWLRVSIEPATERSRYLRFRVVLTESLLTSLRSDASKSASFRVLCSDWPPVSGKVILLRPRPILVEPAAVTLTPEQRTAVISIKPALEGVQLLELRWRPTSTDLQLTTKRLAHGTWETLIKYPDETPPRFLLLQGEVLCQPGGVEPVNLAVFFHQ